MILIICTEKLALARERQRDAWRADGFCFNFAAGSYVGRKVRRTFPRFGSIDGVVVCYLPGRGRRAPLWGVEHEDGDCEDLVLREVEEAIRAYEGGEFTPSFKEEYGVAAAEGPQYGGDRDCNGSDDETDMVEEEPSRTGDGHSKLQSHGHTNEKSTLDAGVGTSAFLDTSSSRNAHAAEIIDAPLVPIMDSDAEVKEAMRQVQYQHAKDISALQQEHKRLLREALARQRRELLASSGLATDASEDAAENFNGISGDMELVPRTTAPNHVPASNQRIESRFNASFHADDSGGEDSSLAIALVPADTAIFDLYSSHAVPNLPGGRFQRVTCDDALAYYMWVEFMELVQLCRPDRRLSGDKKEVVEVQRGPDYPVRSTVKVFRHRNSVEQLSAFIKVMFQVNVCEYGYSYHLAIANLANFQHLYPAVFSFAYFYIVIDPCSIQRWSTSAPPGDDLSNLPSRQRSSLGPHPPRR